MSLVLTFNLGLAVRGYVYVERHGVAADRAVLDVVLVSAPGNIHWHYDFFSA